MARSSGKNELSGRTRVWRQRMECRPCYAKGRGGIRIPGSTLEQTAPVDGGTIHLTIDSDLQWFSQKVMSAREERAGAAWATALIVRIDDGHILAAADWPSVDPNNVDGSKVDDMGARLFSSPYEPGSVVKPITVASMVDQGLLKPSDGLRCRGVFPSERENTLSTRSSTERSAGRQRASSSTPRTSGLNVMAQQLNKRARYDILTSFGIGQKTSVSFLGEDSGFIASP